MSRPFVGKHGGARQNGEGIFLADAIEGCNWMDHRCFFLPEVVVL
jgi:hypothetical protein